MSKESDEDNVISAQAMTNHLANERTYLAWVRTSIGIMAFGFVVEKFSLFMKQFTAIINASSLPITIPKGVEFHGYSSVIGIFLVAFGLLICLFAYLKFKKIEKQIIRNDYRASSLLDTILTVFIFLMGSVLVIYLVGSV